MATGNKAIYGTVPPGLVPVLPEAVQCSPLMPGSRSLEAMADGSLNGMVMLAPAGTTERRYILAHMLRSLQAGAPFTLVAPRDKGGLRIGKELKQFGCTITEDAKQHYRMCTGTRPNELEPIEMALADGAPRFDAALGLWTQPGVFSWDRVDAGSALLLQQLSPLQGQGADLGCGIGTLSRAVLASPQVTKLHMIDTDRRAVEQAHKNVDAAHSIILWADATADQGLQGLDFVVMNPPFHDGGIEDRALGERFIQRAAAMLRPGGSCWLVANRHLPYEAVMKPLFARVILKKESAGFKIYEAVK